MATDTIENTFKSLRHCVHYTNAKDGITQEEHDDLIEFLNGTKEILELLKHNVGNL